MRKVITNHCFQNLLLQSGMVRKSRVMMGRDSTHRIRFMSLSGTAKTLLCSAGMREYTSYISPIKHEGEWLKVALKESSFTVPLRSAPYLQESHWVRVGWGTGESILTHRGRSHCLFWSDCGLANWCRHSNPADAVSQSFHTNLTPDTCSKGSASSGQTHWCEGQSIEPQCKRRRPAGDRQHHTCQQITQFEH